jgi:hypothetical protein
VAAGLTLFASRCKGEMRAGLDTAASALLEDGVDVRADIALTTVGAAVGGWHFPRYSVQNSGYGLGTFTTLLLCVKTHSIDDSAVLSM